MAASDWLKSAGTIFRGSWDIYLEVMARERGRGRGGRGGRGGKA
jgi:hypothetical protein